MSQIDEHLWLGSQKDAANKKFLIANNIRLIISFELFPEISPFIKHITRTHISMYDSMKEANSVNYPQKVLDAISQINKYSNRNVLIHCSVGKSRSASIAIAYMMSTYSMNLEEALNYVKSKRDIDPEQGFLNRLEEMRNNNLI